MITFDSFVTALCLYTQSVVIFTNEISFLMFHNADQNDKTVFLGKVKNVQSGESPNLGKDLKDNN